MTWYDDFGAGTYQTSSGNIDFGLQIHYDRKFLTHAVQQLRLAPLGQKRPIPMGGGKQIRFFRYNPIAVLTSALTEGVNPNATPISGQEVNATIEEWGAFSQQTSLISRSHIDRNLNGIVGLWGDNAAETVDLETWKEVAVNGVYPLLVDTLTQNNAVSLSVQGTVVSETTLNTKTVITVGASDSDTVANSDSWWDGGIIAITAGTNIGQSRLVDTYTVGTTVATITVGTGFEASCDDTTKFRIVTTSSLTTADVPTYKAMGEALAHLKANRAKPMGKDGYYVGLMHPYIVNDLMSDATWIGLEQYRGSVSKIYAGEVGKIMGIRIVETTIPFRCAVTTMGTYSATGPVFCNLILGKEAFGVTTFAGMDKPKIIVKNPGPGDTSNPLNRYGTAGWQLDFVPKALNSNNAVGLYSYH